MKVFERLEVDTELVLESRLREANASSRRHSIGTRNL
jgi:hypothetical protein